MPYYDNSFNKYPESKLFSIIAGLKLDFTRMGLLIFIFLYKYYNQHQNKITLKSNHITTKALVLEREEYYSVLYIHLSQRQ